MLHADAPYPLASVFKVPVMVELLRRVDAGDVRLDEQIELREQDKCPGGVLLFCHAGLTLSVRDLLYFMITQSDNTATDMLWRRIGLGSVNEGMRRLGLRSIDCAWPDREYYLIESRACGPWAGLSTAETIALLLAARSAGETARLIEETNASAAHIDGAAFLDAYEAKFGLSEERDRDESFAFDQALDNTGSPRDVLELLSMIAGDRCASPDSCRLMREVLARQESRDRLPAGLPPGLRVANKTGSVTGTVNDAALVYRPDGRALAVVVLAKQLSANAETQAPAALRAIAAAVWRAFG
jgi:beta-lactamase class A